MGEKIIYQLVLFAEGELMEMKDTDADHEPISYTLYKATGSKVRIGVGVPRDADNLARITGKPAQMFNIYYVPDTWREYKDPRICTLVVEGHVEHGEPVSQNEAEGDPGLMRRPGADFSVESYTYDGDPDDENQMGEPDGQDIANPFRTPEPKKDPEHRDPSTLTPGERIEIERSKRVRANQPRSMHELSKVTLEIVEAGGFPEYELGLVKPNHDYSNPRHFTHHEGCPHLN